MTSILEQYESMQQFSLLDNEPRGQPLSVELAKERMLNWPNPVEFVNNMYGCHPGDENTEYFSVVFRK